MFLVNQSGENDFRFLRTRFCVRQFTQRSQHGGNGTFCVARAATVQSSVFALRNEARSVRADGVEMRREQDGLLDFIFWPQPRDEIGAIGKNFLKFNFQSCTRGDGGEKICDVFFIGIWMARRQKRRIHAGQRDKFGQKFFRARHGRRMSQANALCHFLLDTGFLHKQIQTIVMKIKSEEK